jgi:uncharacterized membrane protein
VSDFVDECRQEWKRLGVPDAVANEMAADITADLQEAEAEGVSAEEVLGSAVFDPWSFAASWATERGVVQQAAAPGGGPVLAEEKPRGMRMLAVVAALAVAIIAGAALLARASRSVGLIGSVRKVVPAPFVGPRAGIRFPVFPAHGPGSDLTHGIGVLLLLVGVAGLIAATIYWSRRARTNH